MNPNIEQFKIALKRGKPEYIPTAELGVHPIMKEKLLGRPIITLKDDVDFWQKAGYDYIKLQPVADFNPGKLFIQDDSTTTFNDDGTISRKWATEGKGIITNWDEFEKYQFPRKEDFDYTRFEQVKSLLPEGMGVIGQYGDIFTMVWELMGFEEFSYALYENAGLIDALFDKIGNLVLSMFEYFAQCDAVDVLWYSDDIGYISNLMMSPDLLRKYFFPWLAKIGDLAKEYDKPFMYHSDGTLFDAMEDIIASGVDALHPIEPKAMDIVEVKKRYGDRLCLIGNLDVGDILSLGSVEDVIKTVKYNIEHVGYNGGYVAGSGNSIPEYVKYENYIAMLDAIREFGR